MEQLNIMEVRKLEHKPVIKLSPYGVKSNGQVWNIRHDRPMVHRHPRKDGAEFVTINVFSGSERFEVARLAVSAWLEIPIRKVIFRAIIYKDGNSNNLEASNLSYPPTWDI